METTIKKGGVLFILIFIYFIAPQIWGLWMVFKLQIISFDGYLHLMTSPLTILLLIAFFGINYQYISRCLDHLKESKERAQIEINKIMNIHLISILLFGGIATLLSSLSLAYPFLTIGEYSEIMDAKVILNCYLSGASLSFVFFIFFTNILAGKIKKMAQFIYPKASFHYKRKFTIWNFLYLIIGLYLMQFTANTSLILNAGANSLDNVLDIMYKNLLILIIPSILGSIFFIKWIITNGINQKN